MKFEAGHIDEVEFVQPEVFALFDSIFIKVLDPKYAQDLKLARKAENSSAVFIKYSTTLQDNDSITTVTGETDLLALYKNVPIFNVEVKAK